MSMIKFRDGICSIARFNTGRRLAVIIEDADRTCGAGMNVSNTVTNRLQDSRQMVTKTFSEYPAQAQRDSRYWPGLRSLSQAKGIPSRSWASQPVGGLSSFN